MERSHDKAQIGNITLRRGNAYMSLPRLEAESFDLILCDPPYETTRHDWDTGLDLSALWSSFERLLVPGGRVVWFSSHPFTARILASLPKGWSYYEVVWVKSIGSNQLNCGWRPLQRHENILVCYRTGEARAGFYAPQVQPGKPYKRHRQVLGQGYGQQRAHTAVNRGIRQPTTVLEISNARVPGEHPSSKPVQLYRWLIAQYSDPCGRILDPFLGSGNAALAAIELNRFFFGIEQDLGYFRLAVNKLRQFQRLKKKDLR